MPSKKKKVTPDAELFDISDVKTVPNLSKNRKTFTVVFTSEQPFNLMKCYLAIREYLLAIEQEVGIMVEDEHSETH